MVKCKVTEEEKRTAEKFYKEALTMLNEAGLSYLVGGAFALQQYTGIYRDTKDLDIFCKASEYPKILKHFSSMGYHTEITDSRWLAKVYFHDDYFMDIIYNTVNNICTVDDSWMENSYAGEFCGVPVQFLSAEELFWCKIYVQNRERFDGADLNHLIVRYGDRLNWNRVWMHLEIHWQLLMAQLLSFQFCYPSKRDLVPHWLMEELLAKAKEQYDLPTPQQTLCLGPLIDQTQYDIDVREWNYKTITMKSI
ncbi:nucleotidyltransferase [Xanthocytophaga flava]|nr:nucleotidyltransferase [Xanthocytophaga flavus]MDJ1470800.1 nucleotidyltransferase [Xanthocytophaga flavus]